MTEHAVPRNGTLGPWNCGIRFHESHKKERCGLPTDTTITDRLEILQ